MASIGNRLALLLSKHSCWAGTEGRGDRLEDCGGSSIREGHFVWASQTSGLKAHGVCNKAPGAWEVVILIAEVPQMQSCGNTKPARKKTKDRNEIGLVSVIKETDATILINTMLHYTRTQRLHAEHVRRRVNACER